MNRLQRTGFSLNARVRRTRSSADNNLPVTPDYTVGENVPSEIARNNAIYDMILVERFSQPDKTEVGLFLPKVSVQRVTSIIPSIITVITFIIRDHSRGFFMRGVFGEAKIAREPLGLNARLFCAN